MTGRLLNHRLRLTRSGRSGVSLVELMVAIVCTGILMVAFSGIFQMLVKMWLRGTNGTEVSQSLSIASSRMGPDVRSALPPYVQDRGVELRFIGNDGATGTPALTGSTGDELRWHKMGYSSYELTSSNYGSEIQLGRYWLKDAGGGVTQLQREERNSTSTDTIIAQTTASTGGSPYSYQITAFQLDYRDSAGVWVTSWDSTTRGELPELIRITVTGTRGGMTRTKSFIARPGATGRRISQ